MPVLCATTIVASMRITSSPEVPLGHPRRRDPPCRASISAHTCRRPLRPRDRDPFPLVRADLVQRPPHVGVRGHRPEQLALVAQHRQVRQHPAAVGDQHRGVDQHPAAVVHRGEPAPAQRPDNAPVNPVRSASSRSAADPACDTTPCPPTSTVRSRDHALSST